LGFGFGYYPWYAGYYGYPCYPYAYYGCPAYPYPYFYGYAPNAYGYPAAPATP
jgi:hypothetical protein